MISVLKAGPLTLVQDLGRPGYAHLGVPHSGAADRPALVRANRLVGNPDTAAALEITLLGPQLRFNRDARIALCGAHMPALLDGKPLPHDASVMVKATQVLRIGAARSGVRAYLAVAGGIDAVPVLGSRSTDILSGLGPAPLADGQHLNIGVLDEADDRPQSAATLEAEPVLHILPGPRDDWFAAGALDTLCRQPYTVSPASNRIGVRLDWPVLPRRIVRELPSEGIVLGAVQVPGDGRPLVFLADHPVTGGYPVIAVVVPEDIPRVAQARPGSRLRFALCAGAA
jgi:biotin-dependent carboxylase-like uncharacterized protein